MNEMGALKALSYSGGEWVIYLLIVSSVLTLAVIFDRVFVLMKERRAFNALRAKWPEFLGQADAEAAAKGASSFSGAAGVVLSAALRGAPAGAASVEEYAAAARLLEKQRLERRLLILGTLGNNAPFIGLFGTVLGVIKAFHDLAETSSAGPEVVMQGLSEALVATAVGLLVAIPAVMAFNALQKGTNDLFLEIDALGKQLLARLKTEKR